MKATSTILIVDDEPVGQQTLEALLLPLNYHLAFASNGAEALAVAAALIPDLILLDVMMPAMDGYEVCRRLRAHPRLADVPIIMITALDDRDSRVYGLQAGADDFIAKPFDRVELRARIQTITRLNRYRRLLFERAKFEWVVEQADDGYLIVSESDNILYINAKARLYLGLAESVPETVAETFLALARQQYRCEPQGAWVEWPRIAVNTASSSRYLMRPESSTANAFWLQVDVLNIPTESAAASRLVRLRDVTTQKALQRDIWQFHAMISHKLRTPMMGMLNALYLLARDVSLLSPTEITEIAQIAFQTTQRFHQAVEKILQYLNAPLLTRHGAGLKLAQFPEMVAVIAAELELKSVSVSNQNETANVQIMFARQAMELVIHELLENAKKFHPTQAPHVEITVSISNQKEASIKITDDGMNLSPQQLTQISRPYYQAEKQLTGQVAGMD